MGGRVRSLAGPRDGKGVGGCAWQGTGVDLGRGALDPSRGLGMVGGLGVGHRAAYCRLDALARAP